MVNLGLILDKLNAFHPIVTEISDSPCMSVLRNEYAVDFHDVRIINLITLKEFHSHKDAIMSGPIFLIGETDTQSYPYPQNTILFPKETNPEELLYATNSVLEEYQRYIHYKEKLDLLTAHTHELQDIFSLFASYFNNPVVFGDSGGNIIYMDNLREDFLDYDESINHWLKNGYVPYEYSKQNGNLAMTALWQKSPEPVLLTEKFAARYHRLSYRTCRYNHVYNNYFCIVEVHEPYRPFDRDVLIYTADVTSSICKNDVLLRDIESPREKALRILIHGNSNSTESDDDRLTRYHMLSAKHMQIAVLDFGRSEKLTASSGIRASAELLHTKTRLDHQHHPILNIRDEEKLILLIQAKTDDALFNQTQSLVSSLDKNTTAGFSEPFEDIHEASHMYQRACITLETGAKLYPEQNIYCFHDLYFDIVSYVLYKEGLLPFFIEPSIQKLVDYDKKKNNEYAVTLYEYIRCKNNMTTVSQKLHIHRNTALYRVTRAKEHINDELDDFETLMRYLISFKAISLLEKMEE